MSRRIARRRAEMKPRLGATSIATRLFLSSALACIVILTLAGLALSALYRRTAEAALVKDHLHECVACRKIYEGKVVAMPVVSVRRAGHPVRWAAAAVNS